MVLSDTVAFDGHCDNGSLINIRQFKPKPPHIDNWIGLNRNLISYIDSFKNNCKHLNSYKNACNQTFMSGSAIVKCLFYKSLNMSASVEKFWLLTVLTILLTLCSGSTMARPNGSGSENTLTTTTTKSDVSKINGNVIIISNYLI